MSVSWQQFTCSYRFLCLGWEIVLLGSVVPGNSISPFMCFFFVNEFSSRNAMTNTGVDFSSSHV